MIGGQGGSHGGLGAPLLGWQRSGGVKHRAARARWAGPGGPIVKISRTLMGESCVPGPLVSGVGTTSQGPGGGH